MARRLQHLLVVTMEDCYHPASWSGIPFSLREALERQVTRVTVYRPPKPRRTLLTVLRRVAGGAKRFPLWITRAALRRAAEEVEAEIARVRPDAVLSISSQCVVYLKRQGVPIFFFSDAPYLAFCEAYARWETAPREVERFGREEAAAARGASGVFMGSAWACGEAARLYGMEGGGAGASLQAVPLGANWVPRLTREEVLLRMNARSSTRLDLLFVGRDWERKGGPLAVEVAGLLREAGHNVTLHIVGCQPKLDGLESFVQGYGRLRQNDPQESARLAELFLTCHFLLVPTLAECFGIVFAEAQAFALPPVSRAVHALPSIIENGVSGLLLDSDSTAAEYAERILRTIADPERYRAMGRRARERFEQRLNWDATVRSMIAVMEQRLH